MDSPTFRTFLVLVGLLDTVNPIRHTMSTLAVRVNLMNSSRLELLL